MPTQAERMRRKYRRFAPVYDFLELAFALPGAVDPRGALAAKIPDGGVDVLDLCCGTGNGVLTLADTSNRIVGVDVSPSMLAVAAQKIRRRGIGNIALEEMDVARLRFDDERFDIVTTSFAMHEFEYDAMCAVVAEAQRVLKPGGRLFVVDYARPPGRLLQTAFSLYLRASYPPHVREFLDYDWAEISRGAGLVLESVEACFVSALVTARKPSR